MLLGKSKARACTLKAPREYFIKKHKLLEEYYLNITQFDIEMMNELGYCPGIENYSRAIFQAEMRANRLRHCLIICRLMRF